MSIPMDEAPARADPAPSSAALLSLESVRHTYGRTVALRDLNFDVLRGEIRGFIGENGSGKSTLVKILSGVITPSGGSVVWEGARTTFRSPRAAQRAGIVTVFQETLVSSESSVRDNVFLGRDGLVRRAANRAIEDDLLERWAESLGFDRRLIGRSVAQLSLAQRQVITLIRALSRPWKLLILDEATSALDLEVRGRLFARLRELTASDQSVLFVSHRMDELQSFVDRATVLRAGTAVATLEQREATPDTLLELMSQRNSAEIAKLRSGEGDATVGDVEPGTTKCRLRCVGVRLAGGRRSFDVTVNAREILGVAGLEGHGGNLFVETLVALRRPVQGAIVLDEGAGISFRSYRQAVDRGIVYVPGNRQVEGLFAPLSVVDNATIATLGRYATAGLFRLRNVLRPTEQLVSRLAVEVASLRRPVELLSGGNQQKVLVGRWLAANPSVLVMNDPLRGVDIGTKREFYPMLRSLAASGVAVVLLSTEIEELIAVCDRVAVFRDRSLEALLGGQQMGYEEILRAMFGQLEDAQVAGA